MVYLVAAIAAWTAAQGLKHLVRLLGHNRRVFQNDPRHGLLLSGGMPSAHSATLVALTTVIGLQEGLNSAVFALAALLSAIVMYDAIMVRFSSGQQGDLLNALIREHKTKLKPVRVAHGHTVVEVVVGAVLGALIGTVVFFTLR